MESKTIILIGIRKYGGDPDQLVAYVRMNLSRIVFKKWIRRSRVKSGMITT